MRLIERVLEFLFPPDRCAPVDKSIQEFEPAQSDQDPFRPLGYYDSGARIVEKSVSIGTVCEVPCPVQATAERDS